MLRTVLINYILLIGVGLLWSVQFVLNKIAISTFPPLVIAAGRSLSAALTMCLVFAFLNRDNRKAQVSTGNRFSLYMRYILLALLEAVLPFTIVVWGQQYVSSSVTAILFGMIPIFVVLLATMFVRAERITITSLLSIIVGFAGICVLVYPALSKNSFTHVLAQLGILSGALSFAVATIIIRTMPPMSPLRLTRNVFMLAALPMVIFVCVKYPLTQWAWSWSAVMAVVFLGVFCSGIVYVLYIKVINRAGVTFASLCNYLVPLFGTFLGMIVLQESLHLTSILALFLILLALFIHRLPQLINF